MKNCQVCGVMLASEKDMGHNDDGSVNEDFCSRCYQNGQFTGRSDMSVKSTSIPYSLGLYGVYGYNGVNNLSAPVGGAFPLPFDDGFNDINTRLGE